MEEKNPKALGERKKKKKKKLTNIYGASRFQALSYVHSSFMI